MTHSKPKPANDRPVSEPLFKLLRADCGWAFQTVEGRRDHKAAFHVGQVCTAPAVSSSKGAGHGRSRVDLGRMPRGREVLQGISRVLQRDPAAQEVARRLHASVVA